MEGMVRISLSADETFYWACGQCFLWIVKNCFHFWAANSSSQLCFVLYGCLCKLTQVWNLYVSLNLFSTVFRPVLLKWDLLDVVFGVIQKYIEWVRREENTSMAYYSLEWHVGSSWVISEAYKECVSWAINKHQAVVLLLQIRTGRIIFGLF